MIREPFIQQSEAEVSVLAGQASLRDALRRARRIGLVVLFSCLILVFLAWHRLQGAEQRELDRELQLNSDRYLSVLRLKLSAEERLLQGAAGLLRASEEVTPQEWAAYVASLVALHSGSDVIAMGIAEFSTDGGDAGRSRLRVTLKKSRAEWHDGPVGADLLADAAVAEAIKRAVASGGAALAVQQVADGAIPVLTMLLPTESNEHHPSGAPQSGRRGVVFVHLDLAALAQSATLGLDGQQHLRILDQRASPPRTLFDSIGRDGATIEDRAVALRRIDDYGLSWTVEFSRHIAPAAGVYGSTVALVIGAIAALLLSLLVWNLASTRVRAELVALRKTDDLRRSEAHLAQSQALLRSVLDGLPSGVLLKDAAFNVTFANRAYSNVVGRHVDEILGRRAREFMEPDIAEIMEFNDGQVLETGAERESEVEIADRAGKRRSYHVRKVALDGEARSVLTVYTDITTLREQALEVQHYQNFLEQLFEVVPHPLYVKDAELRFVRVNREFAKQLGAHPSEILGRRAAEVLPNETAAQGEAQDRELLERGGSGTWNWVLKDSQGMRRELMTAKSLLSDHLGNQMIVGVNTDLSEVRAQSRMIRALIDHLPQRIFIKDRESRYLLVNKTYANDLAMTPEQVVGKSDLDFFPPELAQRYRTDDRRIMESGEGEAFEEPYVHGWLRTTKVPMRDESSAVVGIVVIFDDITERREQEDRLRASEARWQFALEGAGDGVWDWDIGEAHVDYSSRWKSMLGYRDDEIGSGLDEWSSRVHPDDLDRVVGEVQCHLRGETDFYTSEHRLRSSNREYKWILDRGKVVARDGDGNPLRMIGTHTDITSRKRVEQTLAESEARFRLLADSAPNLIWVSDGAEGRNYFNRTWLLFTGGSIERDRGAGWTRSVHPDDFEGSMSIYSAAIEEQRPYETEFRLLRHDGVYRWMLETGVPRFDQDGGFAGFIGSCIDITERREIEIEMRRNRDLLDAINGLQEDFIHSPDTNLVFERMLGWLLPYARCEFGLIGEALDDADGARFLRTLAVSKIVWDEEFGLYRQENAPHTLELRDPGALFGAVLANDGAVISNDTERDPRAQRLPPGHPAMFNFAGLPVRNGDELLGMVGLANREGGFDRAFVDELEPLLSTFGKLLMARRSEQARKHAEDELARHRDHLREMVDEQTAEARAARDEAQRASRVKTEFLSNMSHELRTPMHAILSFAKLGEGRAQKDEQGKLREYFERIHVSGDRLLNLLNDLLDLSKLEAGKMVLDVRPFQVLDLVRDATIEFEAIFQAKGVGMRIVADGEQPRIWVDGARVGQVLRNLLSNAVKFTPCGRGVEIRLARCELPLGRRSEDAGRAVDAVEIVVSDEGVGIPASELERVFDKFVQSSKTRTGAGGTGLGLAITREIVHAHGGTIQARPNANGGTDFVVRLPIRLSGTVNSVSALQR